MHPEGAGCTGGEGNGFRESEVGWGQFGNLGSSKWEMWGAWCVPTQETPGVTGKFGLGVQNKAGQRLIEFCQENALVIANTLFQQHKRRLYTASSGGQPWGVEEKALQGSREGVVPQHSQQREAP